MSSVRGGGAIAGGIVWAIVCALAGCAAGPNFARPHPPDAQHYTPDDPQVLAAQGGAPDQVLRRGGEVDPQWWAAFGSPALDDWVRQALAGSPTLQTAEANLAQARQVVAAARGVLFPQVSLAASAGRGTAQARAATNSLSEVSVTPSVQQTLDFSGLLARRIEQAQAQLDLSGQQWAAARLQLTGNVVLQAFALAAAREQIAAVQDIIALDQRNLELVQVSTAAGKSARLDVLTAESQLASDRALLPPLLQQANAARHALALLAGRTAAEGGPPEFSLDGFVLPPEIPLVLPSQLVQRRPDILVAEAQLRAANAAIGIAQAQLYPQVSLTANGSSTATGLSGLFRAGANTWSLAADLLAPLFSGGTLQAQRDAAIDAYAAQLAIYRQSVLQAFSQVADALTGLREDAELLDAQRKALDTAQNTLTLTQQSYEAGQASLLQLLDIQRSYQQARLGYARARAQRYSDVAQLFIAMGGATPALPAGSGLSNAMGAAH